VETHDLNQRKHRLRHPDAVPDSALNSSSAQVGNVIFSFPRQVLNPTKSVVAGYQGVNCLKQSPGVSFDLLGGTVHGNEFAPFFAAAKSLSA
jgi:hypothetical protein